MTYNAWHNINEKPKLNCLFNAYFSDDLLVKVKDCTLKGFHYMIAYLNDTENVWLNPLNEREIKEEILQWKYIE